MFMAGLILADITANVKTERHEKDTDVHRSGYGRPFFECLFIGIQMR
jgi:hypothetical protein